MQFMIITLACLFSINFFIQSTICTVPGNIQNLELDDITSLWDRFPSIIDKIKEAVSRFRCPKGWKRLGGSCYYLSNLTSTSIEANHTCQLLHSNQSNLMQIRNAVELFYAVHVLSRNNLSSLMIDIDPKLLKGKKISEILMNDQGRWDRMKEKFRQVRVQYQKLKKKIIDQLHSTGLRILRRSKKVKQIPMKKDKPQNIHHDIEFDQYGGYDFDDKELNISTTVSLNELTTTNVSFIDSDEYEYDDLDSYDESDEFEQIDDIRGICDQIDWNVMYNDSDVYILSTYVMSDKTVCSINDAEIDTEYTHVCEYVLDFCFANIVCGKHGQCVNTLAGFKCSCSFLYGGLVCEKISEHGRQIIISLIIILILTALSIGPVQSCLWFIIKSLIEYYKSRRKARKQNNGAINDDKQQLVQTLGPDGIITDAEISQQVPTAQLRRPTIAQEIMDFILPRTSNPLLNPTKRNLVRMSWVGSLTILFLSLLFILTTIIHSTSFHYNINDDAEFELLVNETIRLVTQCEQISDHRMGNLIFSPIAVVLILVFSWSIKRERFCLTMCDRRPGLIPPIEPFHTANRFTTATVFGILASEVLKVFEELLFNTVQQPKHGVLIVLLERIAIVILVGLRYYPVLASLQLRNLVARFFACLYIIGDITYTIVREGSCMGFLPLSGHYTALEEAKLRMELGTWFIIYGLVKNIPHFCFLSYIGAELCVRFAYDALYVPWKKKQSIWSSPIAQIDESSFAKYYVTKLFRRNHHSKRTNPIPQSTSTDNLDDYEHEAKLQNQANQSRVRKFLNSIYHWDDDFRFTTMATCTYTVAIVFLYYLACTFVFLYVSRTTGHISFLKHFVESVFNIELNGPLSLRLEVIVSAILTVIIYGFQLFIGMQNYKKHKIQLYKGIYVDVPSASNFKANNIVSNAVHYSGFLVGYMAWGFVICFHLIFFLLAAIRILTFQTTEIELALAIIVPVLVVYLLKMLGMSSAGKFLFIQSSEEKLNLKSRKTFAIFVYFSFFADCFLGIASCIIRLVKATLLNVVFMARLDWSFLGRPLEKYDLGFAAYVSYLHMEVTYTNPVMLAFCYSLYDDVVQRRPNQSYDDECCIAPSECNDADGLETPTQNQPNLSVINRQRNNLNVHNRTPQIETVSHLPENDSLLVSINRNDLTVKYNPTDDNERISIPKTTSDNPSITSGKKSKKSKKQKTNIDNEEKQSIHTISTIAQQQPDTPVPELPPRHDLSPEQNQIYNTPKVIPHTEQLSKLNIDNPTTTIYAKSSRPTDSSYLRTISYRTAQQSTPPFVLRQPTALSILPNRSHTNDDSSHYSEITTDTTQSDNSSHSTNEPEADVSKQIQNEDITVEIQEDKKEQEKKSQPITFLTNNKSIKSEQEEELVAIRKKKQIRFRWHLAYTIIHNYHLFDLRKEVQSRLARLHVQRSNLIDEEQRANADIVEEQGFIKLSSEIGLIEPQMLDEPCIPVAPLPTLRRTPVPRRLLSIPVPVNDDYPQSPAERYIAIRSRMLYDASLQQPHIPLTPSLPQASTPGAGYNQQLRFATTAYRSDGSLGFPCSPNINNYPSSPDGSQVRAKQTTDYPTPRIFQQGNSPPQFQPISASIQSTDDYPIGASSSTANSATLRTQMSHDQHMQAWKQKQMKKIQKKQRNFCYIYGPPPQPVLPDKVSNAAILIPQIISTATTQQQVPPTPNDARPLRGPTKSQFEFPRRRRQVTSAASSVKNDSQLKTINEKSKTNRPQQTAPSLP